MMIISIVCGLTTALMVVSVFAMGPPNRCMTIIGDLQESVISIIVTFYV